MTESGSIAEQVEANLSKLDVHPEFDGTRLWLTFYLTGPPENLRHVSESLKEWGWINVEDWEYGFLYPKVQVEKAVEAIGRATKAAQELCVLHDIEILDIDADTSPDVQRSQHLTLYRS
jgi:hypothetical protein